MNSFWRASLSTKHFDFEGFGRTRAEAVANLEGALRLHGEQYGLAGVNWWEPYDPAKREQLHFSGYRDREKIT